MLYADLLIAIGKSQAYLKESEMEQLLHRMTSLKPDMNKVKIN